ncbi:MAG: hypothetical protein R3267_11855, partial [Paenisporosarcina sp.]|nr:hypothetical protein [Paenisporosarcina sp.]
TQQLGRTTRKQVEVVVSKITRYPIHEAPPSLMALREETVTYPINTIEFHHLVNLFETDLESFYLYQPKTA